MKKNLPLFYIIVFLAFFTSQVKAQNKPCRFTISYNMGFTDYTFVDENSTPDKKDTTPYTMSGIDILYNFGHSRISGYSVGNFDAGVGVYHFSDDAIMGSYGFKFNLGYKFSTALISSKGIGMFGRGAAQFVYTEKKEFKLVPRATLGVCYKGLQLGAFGEFQNTSNSSFNDSGINNSSNAYTLGVEFRFNLH